MAEGVALKSAATAVRRSVEALCSVAEWFVWAAVASNPTIAKSETAATPRAMVSSTRENAGEEGRFIVYRF